MPAVILPTLGIIFVAATELILYAVRKGIIS